MSLVVASTMTKEQNATSNGWGIFHGLSSVTFSRSPQFPPVPTVSDTGEGSKVIIPSILRANPLLNFASILYSGQTPLIWEWADLNSAESGIAGVGLALIFIICLAIPQVR